MAIKSFPYGIPFTSSYSINAGYTQTASVLNTQTASLAEFVTGFTGPTGPTGSILDDGGQFTIVPSKTIQFVSAATSISGAVTFPTHQAGDLIILYGETPVYTDPFLSQSALNDGWTEIFSTTNPSTVLAVKFASSSVETFPTFSTAADAPVHNAVVVYRNVDNFVGGGESISAASVSTLSHAAATSPNFTANRNHWIVEVLRAQNFSNSLTPVQIPRTGFTNRLIVLSGSVAYPSSSLIVIHDSNQVTGSIGTSAIQAINASTNYATTNYVLRAALNYSQFET